MKHVAVRILDQQDDLVLMRLAEDECERFVETLIIPSRSNPARMARPERTNFRVHALQLLVADERPRRRAERQQHHAGNADREQRDLEPEWQRFHDSPSLQFQ